MLSFLVFFLLVTLATCNNSSTCTQTKTCITDTSMKCSGVFGSNCVPGKDAQCCPRFNYCLENTCVLDNYGASCEKKSECYYDQIGTRLYDCITGKCTALFNQGDKCASVSECYGGMDCVEGICQGVKEGEACLMPVKDRNGLDVGFDCMHGLFCSGNVCRKVKQEGDNCTSQLECEIGTLCYSGQCVRQFSLKQNQTCIPGLCDMNTVCVHGKCVNGDKFPKPLVCYGDGDCKNGHCSDCNPFTGTQQCISDDKKPALNCKNENKVLLDCYTKNNCSNTFAYQVGTCQHDNCLIEMQASWYCSMCLDEDSLGTCYGRFDINGHCIIPLPYWLVSAIIGGFTVILFLFLLILCKIGDACHAEDDHSGYSKIN